MLARIVRRMTSSNLLGTIAGFLLAIDGVAIVLSRTALLDGKLAFLVLAAFGALVLDRDAPAGWAGTQPAAVAVGGGGGLGLACGVKWSGLWFVVAFGPLDGLLDLGIRRQRRGAQRSAADTRAGPAIPAALVIPPIAFLTYLATWYGWFTRAMATTGRGPPTTVVTPAPKRRCARWRTTTLRRTSSTPV